MGKRGEKLGSEGKWLKVGKSWKKLMKSDEKWRKVVKSREK